MSTKQKSTALTTPQQMAMAVPDFIKAGDRRGTENITSADIRPPALRIAQAMSPEVKRSEAAYIEGLVEGTFFDSVTKEIYGEGPLGFVVVNQLGHRNVEFEPGNTGVVLDFAVADDDPRAQFTTETRDGKTVRVKPRATKFYDYLVLVVFEDGRRKLMTVSFKSTQLKKAVTLNTILKGSKLPSFAHLFNVSPVPEKRGNNSFYGWKIDMAGYVSEEIYNEASDTFESMRGKNVVVATEGEAGEDEGEGEDAPF